MAMTFPRERNGHVDSGTQLACSRGTKCPNCGSRRYRETLSTEDCPDCGLHCDYWGSGANAVYDDMMATNEAVEQEQRPPPSEFLH